MPLLPVLRRKLVRYLLTGDGTPELLKRAVMTTTRSSFNYDVLPRPDPVLDHFAPLEGVEYYPRSRRQLGYVAGVVKLRTDAVLALPHVWIPGDPFDQESLDWCEGVRQAWDGLVDREQSMRSMMLCVADGLMIGEVVYGVVEVAITVKPSRDNPSPAEETGRVDRVETWICPVRIIDLPLKPFYFDRDLNLRMRPRDGSAVGELVDEMQVVVARYGSGQPHGRGDQQDISQDIWKLDWVDREGLKALEKQGFPMAQVTVPEAWDEDRVRSTLAWADLTYKNFMIVRMGDRFEISFPDELAHPTFIGSDQVTRIHQIQDDIAVGYLGVSFSNSQTGAKARDQVRNEMRFEKTAADAAVYDGIANNFEKKVRLLNRPGMPAYKRARMTTDYKPTQDVNARANLYVQAVQVGYPASSQQFGEEFGLRPAISKEDRLTAPKTAAGQQGQVQMNRNITDPAQNDQPGSSTQPQ